MPQFSEACNASRFAVGAGALETAKLGAPPQALLEKDMLCVLVFFLCKKKTCYVCLFNSLPMLDPIVGLTRLWALNLNIKSFTSG